jgi:predicted transposase YbfD/YdcC
VAKSHDKGRNRDESRIVSVFKPADKLAGSEWHPFVASIIRVERKVLIRNAKTGLFSQSSETAFYIANTPLTAEIAAGGVRGHWQIETTSHYSRDVTMGEDSSRIRTYPGVFARLRSFAFNILKADKKDTMPQDRYRAALAGLEALLKMLTIS